jgi:ATP-dependent DNA ligase
MTLPLPTSFAPMEADPAVELPLGPNWQYEPKWDGFRCLAFRDGAKIELESKSQKSLTRYFPELAAALRMLNAAKFVLDGEIVIAIDGKLSFDHLLQRIHPAASRVQKLSTEEPALYVIFDLLVDDLGKSRIVLPLEDRRRLLEKFAARYLDRNKSIKLSPRTEDIRIARKWFSAGTGLDGIIAKRKDLPYQTGKRTGMEKIKRHRTADCVVGGFRYLQKKKQVGSLLLGLFNAEGELDHIGFCSSIADQERATLTKKLEKLIGPPGFTGKAPGGPSRWSTKESMKWEPLKTKLVTEVEFDQFSGGRFRHGTKLLRWRPDKDPRTCTVTQVWKEAKSALNLLND